MRTNLRDEIATARGAGLDFFLEVKSARRAARVVQFREHDQTSAPNPCLSPRHERCIQALAPAGGSLSNLRSIYLQPEAMSRPRPAAQTLLEGSQSANSRAGFGWRANSHSRIELHDPSQHPERCPGSLSGHRRCHRRRNEQASTQRRARERLYRSAVQPSLGVEHMAGKPQSRSARPARVHPQRLYAPRSSRPGL